MIKKKVIVGIVMLSFVLIMIPVSKISGESITYTIQGQEENYTYNFDELWRLYKGYSSTYKRSIITHEMEELKNKVATINYETANQEYTSIINVIEDLKFKKNLLEEYKQGLLETEAANKIDTVGDDETIMEQTSIETKKSEEDDIGNLINEIDIQIASIDAQIIQYNNNKNAAGTNAADAKLQENLSYFYKNHQVLLLKGTQSQLELDFMKRCFQLILEQEQIQYDKEYKEYLSVFHSVEEIKYNNGYSNKQDLEQTKLNLLKSNYKLRSTEKYFFSSLSSIQNDINIKENSTLNLTFDWEKKDFDIQKITEEFLNNNMSYLQLKNMESSYQTYLNSLGITNYALYEQVKLQIENYQLQQNELIYDIENYVKNAINQYNFAFGELEIAKEQLNFAKQECIRIQAKIDVKKGTKLDLYKAYTDKASADIIYYNSIYKIFWWDHVIMNHMYGALFQ